MSEQDDEQWITERLDGVGSCADDMRAAIARGYERGRGESRDEIGNAVAILDEAGVECEDEIGERTLAGRVAALHRDRDRLAKRCADLESRLAIADKAEAHARAQVDAYHDIGASSRLAALEQRVGGIVETLRAKLAEAERCAQESADIMRRARDRAESYCLRLGEAESQRDAFRAHAIKLDALCVRAANLLRDWCGTEPRALAEDIRARGEVPR